MSNFLKGIALGEILMFIIIAFVLMALQGCQPTRIKCPNGTELHTRYSIDSYGRVTLKEVRRVDE